MIKEIIEQEHKLQLVREVNVKNMQDLVNFMIHIKHASSVSYGVNVMEDERSLITYLRAGKVKFYAIVRDDNMHRITLEYGLKIELSNGSYKTMKPRNYDDYDICNCLAVRLVKSIYEVLELGKIHRNEE